MWQKYSPQGLVVLALSDESKSIIQKFMKDTTMPYPVGAGSPSATPYGVQGIPRAFLLDHDGMILWTGHPGGDEWVELIPAALEAAKEAADSWDPGERPALLDKAASYAREGKLGASWKELERLQAANAGNADLEAFRADFEALAARRLERSQAMTAEGRYAEAGSYLERQAELFKGTPFEAGLREPLAAWKKDAGLKELFKLDKDRLEVIAMLRQGERKEAREALRELRKKAQGTPLSGAVERLYESSL